MDKKFPSDTLQNDWGSLSNPGPDRDVPEMKCPTCGAGMVRRYDPGVCLSYPPQRKLEWWCGCGKTLRIRFEEIPGSRHEKPPWEREWEEANPEQEPSHA